MRKTVETVLIIYYIRTVHTVRRAIRYIQAGGDDNTFPTRGAVYRAQRLNTERAGPTRLLPGLAGADLIFQWIGLVEYIPS